jgi:hypothetical protein
MEMHVSTALGDKIRELRKMKGYTAHSALARQGGAR